MEHDQKKLSIDDILGKQTRELLNDAGITNLKIEEDGSISGMRSAIEGQPVTEHLTNIKVGLSGNRIVIQGRVKENNPDDGKII